MPWIIKQNIRRGGFLRGYFINQQPASVANYGDTITYSVVDSAGNPVTGQIWLTQYINGVQSFNGPFSVPMAPYTLTPHDRSGDYISIASTIVNGQKGSEIERSSLEVNVTGGGTVNTPGVQPGAISTPTLPPPPLTGGGPANITIPINLPMPAPVPGSPGGAPAAGGGPTFGGGDCLTTKYRFILQNQDGTFATGANRPGCSQTNSANCDPQLFATLDEVLSYAAGRGETPYQVLSAGEPFDIMACRIPIDNSRIIGGGIPWWVWAGAAFLGYKLLVK